MTNHRFHIIEIFLNKYTLHPNDYSYIFLKRPLKNKLPDHVDTFYRIADNR